MLESRIAHVARERAAAAPADAEEAVDLDSEALGEVECRVVSVESGVWRLTGDRIEKAAAMTNWDYAEAQDRFQRIMSALGASKQLRSAGAKNGDLIMVRASRDTAALATSLHPPAPAAFVAPQRLGTV